VVLYDSPPSGNCYKVRLLLAHLGLPYERRFVDAIDRSNKREELDSLAPARFIRRFSGRPEAFADRLDQLTKTAHRALGTMERHLDGSAFFVGDRLSLADIALYAYTHIAHEAGLDLEQYPKVRAWLDRVAAVPGHVPMEAE
jgi:glutathione S-transferase